MPTAKTLIRQLLQKHFDLGLCCLFMRGSRNFVRGSRSIWQKSSDNVFFLSLFYRSQMLMSKKTICFQGSRGGPTFSRGGVQLLIPYRNPYNVWFSRGGGGQTPCPPLWTRTYYLCLFDRQLHVVFEIFEHLLYMYFWLKVNPILYFHHY